MCTVADWVGGDECLRLAMWRIEPPDDHPVFLCNFHAEPFYGSHHTSFWGVESA